MFTLSKRINNTWETVATFDDRRDALEAFDLVTLDAVTGDFALRVVDVDGNPIATFTPTPIAPTV